MTIQFFTFFLLLILASVLNSNCLQLTQVVIFSRHNIRTPLTVNLGTLTPKEWPKWKEDVGCLTAKGALLESHMGEYFFAWLNKERLLTYECPKEDSVFIYSNTKQRTKETAKAFTNAAFSYCNVTVHYKNITEMDPIFNPVIHNTTKEFKTIVTEAMQKKLNDVDLKEAYKELESIIDYKKSPNCIQKNLCSLLNDKNEVSLVIGEEPSIIGPVSIGNSVVDSFLMSYYEGAPLEEIGWGKIKSEEQWKLLTKFSSSYQNLRFNISYAAKDYANPLIHYMTGIFLNKKETPFNMLVGHDSNISSMTAALGFKWFVLPGQYEKYPIGGKLVFQKWKDDNDQSYLKVDYVYQTWQQLRNGERLSLENPPNKVTLEMVGCETDERGLCPWSDFTNVLKEFV